MEELQDKMIEEREKNLLLLGEDERKKLPKLPKDLITEAKRIQKFINQLKNISEQNHESLLTDLSQLNLTKYVPEVVTAIALSKMRPENQQTTCEICVLMHQRYEDFAEKLIKAIEKKYHDTPINEFAKKRYILRYLTELYFKGLFCEYKRVFFCLSRLTQLNYTSEPEEFTQGMMVLTDYMKLYGDTIF
jgi:hypothetical protein